MTVAFVGGTGVSTTGAAKGTTSTTVAFNNVAAGRLAVLTVGAKPNTATINAPTDSSGVAWTKVGEQTGGTGTTANDTGQTKTATFVKVLSGSESGNITCTGTSSGSIQGALDVYSKTRPNWDASLFFGASDATHGTNHSATSGTLADGTGVNTGDFLHVGHSGDTDDSTTATSAPTITQSGSTIGTVTARSEVRNTSGNQSRTATWSAAVSAGNHNDAAVVTGFTWSVSSCGPDLTTVIREYDHLVNLVDTFDSAIDSAKWDSGGTVGVTSGAAVLDVSGYTYLASTGSYAFGAGDAVVLHTLDFPTTGGTYYAGMRIGPKGNGGGDFIGIYFHGDGTVSFERSGSTNVDVTLVEANFAWIRIRHDGTDVYLEYSATGSSWTLGRKIDSFDLPAWAPSTGLEVVIEGAEGDSWTVDDFNNAPTSNDTTGTASTAVSASAAVATARTTTGTAAASATATATTTKTVATTGTAPAGAAASATTNRAAVTTGTASTAATASATVATARTTTGTASAALSATATRAGVHTTTGTAALGASASASVAGVRTSSGTGSLAATATASTATTRPTTGTAATALAASVTSSSARSTEGAAGMFVTATSVIEGEESHTSSGEAEVFVTASATTDTERDTAATATAATSASATVTTARTTTGTASAAVTATAVSEATEAHTTSGAAPVAMSATATHASARVVARVAALLASATATTTTSRTTTGAATVHVTASTLLASHALSGHPRIVAADRAARIIDAGRQARNLDVARPRRRAG